MNLGTLWTRSNDSAHLQWCLHGYHAWDGGDVCKVCEVHA